MKNFTAQTRFILIFCFLCFSFVSFSNSINETKGTKLTTVPLSHFIEDVESQPDFAISDFSGGWQTFNFDLGKSRTPFHTFPNKDSLQAFIVFNTATTTPTMTGNTFFLTRWGSNSGDKSFLCRQRPVDCNSWLVTPELQAETGGIFSFYAFATAGEESELQQFKVGYSLSDTDSTSFTFLSNSSGNIIVEQSIQWTLHTYTIPAGVKHIAIVCVTKTSPDRFWGSALSLDDLAFHANSKDLAPGEITLLSVRPDIDGNRKTNLSWTNPTITVDSTALSNLEKIVIYRGVNQMSMLPIATLTDMSAGAIGQYTDASIPAYGDYYYRIEAVNSVGNGIPVYSDKTFVGKEAIAGSPHYLNFTHNDQSENIITWNKVDYGENGGILDGDVTGYTLIRTLGTTNDTIARFIPDTSFVESPAPPLNQYVYRIIPQKSITNEGISLTKRVYSGLQNSQYGIGDGDKSFSRPVDFNYDSYLSQSIYPAKNFDEAGILTSLNWFGNFYFGSSGSDSLALKIYVSSTPRFKFGDKTDGSDAVWIFYGDQTLVFDGIVKLENGRSVQKVIFQNGFYYDPSQGENLAITVIRPTTKPTWISKYKGSYFNTACDSVSTYYSNGFSSDMSVITAQPPKIQGNTDKHIPNIVHQTQNDFATININVKAGGNNVDSCSIEFLSKETGTITNYYGYTDANGNVSDIRFIPGTYTVNYEKEGFLPISKEVVLEANANLQLNETLSNAFPLILEGFVKNKGNTPIAGATVAISGYSSATTTTNDLGYFSLAAFQNQSYTMETIHPLYHDVSNSLVPPAEDSTTVSDIILYIYPYKAKNVIAAIETNPEEQVAITWEAPAGAKNEEMLQWGTGIQSTSWGSGGTEFAAAVKFLPEDLDAELNASGGDSYYLNSIKTYSSNLSDIVLEVYEAVPGGTPILIYSQNESIIEIDVWNTFEMKKPVAINKDKELWLAIRFYVGHESYPIGVDDGPVIASKGNMINEGSGWRAIGLTNKNWCIYGNVSQLVQASPTSYTLSRGITGEENEVNTWTVLEENTTVKSYEDKTVLPSNVYTYAVKANYPDDSISDWSFSNEIRYNMDFDVICKLENVDIEEAFIALSHSTKDDLYHEIHLGAAETTHTFNLVEKGTYTLTVLVPNVEPYIIESVIIDKDTILNLSLQEILCAPANLSVDKTGESAATINWELIQDFEESFESYEDFNITKVGPYKLYDVDKTLTNTFTNFSFPNAGKAMSFIVFNPHLTIPSITFADPYEGRRFLANTSEEGATSNDWIIISCGEGDVSFQAKSATSALEKFKVLYSSTTDATADFNVLLPEAPATGNSAGTISVPITWTEYNYKAPKGTRYIAIQGVSFEGALMMIDNIIFPKPYNHASAFDLYLDGTKVETIENTSSDGQFSYVFENISSANRTLGVVAKFAGGESTMSTISLEGLDNENYKLQETATFNIYPNPSTDGNFTISSTKDNKTSFSLSVYNTTGKKILQKNECAETTTISLKNEPSGLYILEIRDENSSRNFKLIRK